MARALRPKPGGVGYTVEDETEEEKQARLAQQYPTLPGGAVIDGDTLYGKATGLTPSVLDAAKQSGGEVIVPDKVSVPTPGYIQGGSQKTLDTIASSFQKDGVDMEKKATDYLDRQNTAANGSLIARANAAEYDARRIPAFTPDSIKERDLQAKETQRDESLARKEYGLASQLYRNLGRGLSSGALPPQKSVEDAMIYLQTTSKGLGDVTDSQARAKYFANRRRRNPHLAGGNG